MIDTLTKQITEKVMNNRFTTTGKRKNAVAALLYDEKITSFTINNKSWLDYFPQERHQLKILSPFQVAAVPLIQNIKFKVIGGGISAQSEAVRHAISKLLKLLHGDNATLIKNLKQNNFLTRDSRKKERDKPGQRGARAQFNSKKR
jgi:small subunit ribosomal protein S9